MQSRCGPCTGACAPSPMPRLLRPVPAFPVFCCPRPVARVLRPAPRARVFRLLHFVPPFPVFCCPRPVARVLRPASCVLRPAPRAPVARCPCPRPRPRPRVPRFASCAPRPRLPCSAPAPRTRTRTRGPAALRSVPVAPHPRLLRPVPVPPSSASRGRLPVFRALSPPRTSGQVLPASASRRDEKKIGRLPRGTSRFCMHCSGARLTRACG